MAQTARKTLVAALPSTSKAILLVIKSSVTFSWGFLNTIVFLLTRRFATLMTGNTLTLAIETRHWLSEEMLLTSTLIILYVFGGALYDGLSIGFPNNGRVLKLFAIPTTVLMGVLSDVMQFFTHSCVSGKAGMPDCTGRHLYFLAPMALLTGIVTSYFTAHPDGLITNLITGHMKLLPKSLLKQILRGNSALLEKGLTSASIVTFFYLGSLSGTFAYQPIMGRYSEGLFIPLFTSFSCAMALLCFLHYTLCDQFCFNYELEQALLEEMRTNIMKNKRSARATTMDDVRKMMFASMKGMESNLDLDQPLLTSVTEEGGSPVLASVREEGGSS